MIYSKIAFSPLNIPKIIINEEVLNFLVDKFNTGHHDKIWKAVPLCGRVEKQSDFLIAEKIEEAWEKRYQSEGTVCINEEIYDYITPLYEHLKKLPLTITHAQILNQYRDVPRHYDMKHKNKNFIDDYPNVKKEPNGFKILLNCFDIKSFYVCETFKSDPIFIKLPEDSNTFVINEKTFPHGAIKPFQRSKYVVSIFGLVHDNVYTNLLNESIKKYKDYVISF